MKRRASGKRKMATLLFVSGALSHLPNAGAADCSGAQAQNTVDQVSGQYVYVPQGKAFHVNLNAVEATLNAASSTALASFEAGIKSWAQTSGITIVFDSSAPGGAGVVTVTNSTTIDSVGMGSASFGGSGVKSNQITGGSIQLNLGFSFPCTTGVCRAYDPQAPNADRELTGLGAHEMGHVLGLQDTTDSENPCTTQKSTSVMGGQCGTNNNGDGMSPAAPTSTTPTNCDKENVQANSSVGPRAPSGGGSGGGNVGGGGGGGRGGGGTCYGYEEWDDSTNTLTYYYVC